MWNFRGQKRPSFADEPGPGEESVWDYPRPPILLPDDRVVEVRQGADMIARSKSCLRLCETASPPTFYIPPEDIDLDRLGPAEGQSFCAWKGVARYWRLAGQNEAIAWSYPEPNPAYAELKDWLSYHHSMYSNLSCRFDSLQNLPIMYGREY